MDRKETPLVRLGGNDKGHTVTLNNNNTDTTTTVNRINFGKCDTAPIPYASKDRKNEGANADNTDIIELEYTDFLNGKTTTGIHGGLPLEAVKDMQESGLSGDILRKAGVKLFCGSNDELKKIIGFGKINDHQITGVSQLVEFAYSDESGRIVLIRYKLVPPVEELRYIQPKGELPVPYIIPQIWLKKDKVNQPLWITEGEKKALKLIQHGEYAIALSGIWNFKAGKNSECENTEKYIWADLRKFAWKGRTVYISFDSDLWVNPAVRMALLELAVKLHAFGGIVRIVKWDRTKGKGIDDYIVTSVSGDNGFATEEMVIRLLTETSIPLFRFVNSDFSTEIIRAIALSDMEGLALDQAIKILKKQLGAKESTIRQEIDKKRAEASNSAVDEANAEGTLLAEICGLKYIPRIPQGYKITIENGRGYLSTERTSKNGGHEISEIGPVVAIASKIVTEETKYCTIVGDTKHCQIIKMAISADGSEFETGMNNTIGVVVDRGRIMLYQKYLSDFDILNNLVIPKIIGLTRTGWEGDRFLLPSIEREGFLWTDSRLTDAFRSAGEDIVESGRLQNIINTPAGVVTLAMLSAPFLHIIGIENYAVNITGFTAEGKSTSVRVGASLFGNPIRLMATWFATKVGSEFYAAMHRDIFVWFDEVETAGKNLSGAIDFIYQFCSGVGKSRGTIGVSLRKTLEFRGVLVTTSEKTLDSIISQVKEMRTQPWGLYRRVLEIKATDSYYKPFTGDVVTNLPELSQHCNSNYGHFGAKWIAYVTANRAKIAEDYKTLHKDFSSEIYCGGLESTYAALLTVLYCLHDMGVIDKPVCHNAEGHLYNIARTNMDKMNKVLGFHEKFLTMLADFCIVNLKKFTPDPERVDSLYGKIYRGDVFIITAGLGKLCREEGLVMEQVLDELHKHNRLQVSVEKGKNGKVKTRRGCKESLLGKKVRGYKILGVFEPEEVQTDG